MQCPNCGGQVQPNSDAEGNVGICSACKMAVDMDDPTGENWEAAPEDTTPEPERAEDQPQEDAETLVDAHTREELDEMAADAGVEGASSMDNKTEVAEAIVASRSGGEDGEEAEASA